MKHLKKYNETFTNEDTFSLQELKDAITMAYNKDRTMEFDDDYDGSTAAQDKWWQEHDLKTKSAIDEILNELELIRKEK
jgi:hypothetical protein